jgi:glycolate oxidase FAD binding subunit
MSGVESDSGGVAARWSVGVSSVIQERVRVAHTSRAPVRITGKSNWLRAGRPVTATNGITVADYDGVVDYVPGDLTITLRAGTTLSELARITGEQGQWFPINPFGADNGTIGATVATGSSGPLAHGFGSIRDLVLGIEAVTGEAKVIRGGGRVVKNVAGFDLVRLFIGSWGTLGVITELSLRLYASPQHRMTMTIDAPIDPRRLAEHLRALLEAPIIPFAVELISSELARRIGLPPRELILLEIGGNAAAVAAQRDALGKLAQASEAPADSWQKLRTIEGEAGMVFRLSGLPTGLAARWAQIARIAAGCDGAMLHASVGRGTVRCIFPDASSIELIELLSTPDPNDTVIFETLPPNLWEKLSPSATADRVSQGLRAAFDPLGLLNPGILGPLN